LISDSRIEEEVEPFIEQIEPIETKEQETRPEVSMDKENESNEDEENQNPESQRPSASSGSTKLKSSHTFCRKTKESLIHTTATPIIPQQQDLLIKAGNLKAETPSQSDHSPNQSLSNSRLLKDSDGNSLAEGIESQSRSEYEGGRMYTKALPKSERRRDSQKPIVKPNRIKNTKSNASFDESVSGNVREVGRSRRHTTTFVVACKNLLIMQSLPTLFSLINPENL